jgi:hypothetical protein
VLYAWGAGAAAAAAGCAVAAYMDNRRTRTGVFMGSKSLLSCTCACCMIRVARHMSNSAHPCSCPCRHMHQLHVCGQCVGWVCAGVSTSTDIYTCLSGQGGGRGRRGSPHRRPIGEHHRDGATLLAARRDHWRMHGLHARRLDLSASTQQHKQNWSVDKQDGQPLWMQAGPVCAHASPGGCIVHTARCYALQAVGVSSPQCTIYPFRLLLF